MNRPFHVPDKNLNLFLHDRELREELAVAEVKDHEYALHFEDGLLIELLRPGKYAYWNALKKHEFVTVDTREPAIGPELVHLLPDSRLVGSF